ncbi:gliding motility protein GldM [Prevotella sp. 10(H)]|uniref:type IX secretion system motor protein PorM/GldM n=1 Tax=Prevotella sp. 10(H) TaxID=1158294 RepID=UPI0004A712A1|nr:gliding motility protein GldM [Prevotella sp. 10(H)]
MALSRGQMTRQKMINLMYLVFIAMLALNVSTEVLDGFVLVNDNLQENIEVTNARNKQIYTDIDEAYTSNPEKAKTGYDISQDIRRKTDSLFNYIQYLKQEIAKKSDGADADIDNLKSKDNLDASSEVMISPVGGQGNKLKGLIDEYRDGILVLISDNAKKDVVSKTLSTEPNERARKDGKSWLQASFDRMPSIAAITFLSELQVNVRQAEGEVLNNLIQNIDIKDLRVNQLSAFVVPQSNMVMRGTNYSAQIIMAAVDTTQRPTIVVNGKELPKEKNGLYEFNATGTGKQSFNGYIEMMDRSGLPLRREFKQEYTVMEPMATVAPLLMDVLYSGIPNQVSISVPGVAVSDVSASALDGGTLTSSGNGLWVATPSSAKIGQKFVIAVTAKVNGVSQIVARKEFRIRPLPPALAYIEYNDANGSPRKFRKGALSRAVILNSPGIKASIDDGILDIQFTVLSFRTYSFDAMGNTTPELSNGASFSQRQIEQIRRMNRGTRFFIGDIKVKGPDGVEQETNPMQITIN